jgi:hypothetical protein
MTLLVLGAIAGIMSALFVLPRVRASFEKDHKPVYEEISIGWFIPILGMPAGSNFSPYRLSLYDNFFVISTITKNIFPYEEVVELKKGKLNQLSFLLADGKKLTLLLPKKSTRIIDFFKKKGVSVQ